MAIKQARKSSVKRIRSVVPKEENLDALTMIESSSPKKLRESKFFIPLVIIAIVLILFYFKGLFVAALVNGQPIARLSLIKQLEKQGGKQVLSALVNQALIFQEAKKKNIDVNKDDQDKYIKKLEDSFKAQGQNLDTALVAQGMTRQDLIIELKPEILVEKLVADKIIVTDKEVSDYIEKNKDTLPTDLKEDEIKKGIMEQLKQQRLVATRQEFIANLLKKAKINYFINY